VFAEVPAGDVLTGAVPAVVRSVDAATLVSVAAVVAGAAAARTAAVIAAVITAAVAVIPVVAVAVAERERLGGGAVVFGVTRGAAGDGDASEEGTSNESRANKRKSGHGNSCRLGETL
jgi:hypothetical protein